MEIDDILISKYVSLCKTCKTCPSNVYLHVISVKGQQGHITLINVIDTKSV